MIVVVDDQRVQVRQFTAGITQTARKWFVDVANCLVAGTLPTMELAEQGIALASKAHPGVRDTAPFKPSQASLESPQRFGAWESSILLCYHLPKPSAPRALAERVTSILAAQLHEESPSSEAQSLLTAQLEELIKPAEAWQAKLSRTEAADVARAVQKYLRAYRRLVTRHGLEGSASLPLGSSLHLSCAVEPRGDVLQVHLGLSRGTGISDVLVIEPRFTTNWGASSHPVWLDQDFGFTVFSLASSPTPQQQARWAFARDVAWRFVATATEESGAEVARLLCTMASYTVTDIQRSPLVLTIAPRVSRGPWHRQSRIDTDAEMERLWVVANDTDLSAPAPASIDRVLLLCGYEKAKGVEEASAAKAISRSEVASWIADVAPIAARHLLVPRTSRDASSTVPNADVLDALTERLARCPPGKEGEREFELWAAQALEQALSTEFQNFLMVQQARSAGGIHRRDFVIVNYEAPTGFWASLSQKYGTQLLVVDAKNYSEPIKATTVDNILKYLTGGVSKPFGKAALLVSRHHDTTICRDYRERLVSSGTLILHISADDLLEMVHSAQEGRAASSLLLERRLALELSAP